MSSKEKQQTEESIKNKNDNDKSVSIRIRGLGNDIKVSSIDPSVMRLSDLQALIESRTGLPSPYQRIICNGKTLTSTTYTEEEKDDLTLAQLGIKRFGTVTKVILMHSPAYGKDQDTIKVIVKLSNELELLEMQASTFEKKQIVGEAPEGKRNEREEVQEEKGDCDHEKNEDKNNKNREDKDKESKKYISQLHHQLTAICCKLDAIDVTTSPSLRLMRKRILQRADLLEEKMNKLKLQN